MAITYQPRTGLPQWSAGADPFTRAQVDDAFAKLESYMGRGEQGPLNQLPAPAAPTLTTANVGGTLAAGVKGYRITALSPAGGSFAAGETTPSAETTINVPAGTATNTVTVNWVAVPGATGYRIYGRTAGAELLLATVGAVVTWTDTGANPPAGALPAVNTTAGRPAPGIRNRTYWATDDRTGRYSYDDGAAWHDLGPSPVNGPQAGSTALIVGHAAAATSDAVLVMRGKTGQTGDLLKAQDPTGATDYLRVTSAGELISQGASTANVFGARTTGDAADRYAVRGDGRNLWGDGILAGDTPLYRDTANRLTLGGSLAIAPTGTVNPPLTVTQAAGGNVSLIRVLDSSATKVFEAQSSGSIFASGTSSYFGPFALGGATTGPRARVLASSASIGLIAESDAALLDVNVLYRVKGAGTHRFQDESAVAQLTIDNTGTLLAGDGTTSLPSIAFLNTPGMGLFRQAATQMGLRVPAAGWFSFRGAGTEVARLTDVGSFAAVATDSYFGANALAGTGARLHINTSSTTDVGIFAESSGSNANLNLRQKGTGLFQFQTSTPTTVATIDNTGALSAIGDAMFGSFALGTGTLTRLRVNTPSATQVVLYAEGSGANVGLELRAKGAGSIAFCDPSGVQFGRIYVSPTIPAAGNTALEVMYSTNGTGGQQGRVMVGTALGAAANGVPTGGKILYIP